MYFLAIFKLNPLADQTSKLMKSKILSVRKSEAPNLQVFRAELVSIHVDSREEYGLHLVVPQLVAGQVRGDENLQEEES